MTILGVPAQYTGSGVYDLTVRVSDPTKLGAGFQLSAEDAVGGHVGTLSVIDSINTQLNADNPHWVNHTLTGVNNSVANWAAMGNAAEFTVRWQAPAINAGPVTFWAVGNAINNNGSLTGDLVYLTSTTAASGLVPAVSTWGLAVLTLAMLAAGAATLKRGAPAASFEPAGC